jgi:hypothetical protein
MDHKTNPRKSFAATLREASQFYLTQGNVYDTLRRLTRRLDAEAIPYALVGGMALAAHGFVRMTQDIDILMTAEGLAEFRDRCVGRGYAQEFNGAQKSFCDTLTHVRIAIITTGEYPGDGKPKPVVFPDPASSSIEQQGARVITLEKLIVLKLASGMTAPDRLRDLADVQDVIVLLNLPEDLAERLDAFVSAKYRELWVAASSRRQEDDR